MDKEKIVKQIEKERWYKPREIAKNGWIRPPFGKTEFSAYLYVLKLIKTRKLKAKNVGLGQTPYFVVKGDEIVKFIKENY